ncbi:nucleotidyltransferase domain-containing protein [Paenibacillus gallinarum]|uniref:Cyclic GMP-AMP synthase n=1 Tax=Paenibacillus gallinarum TaxID=2762232 RepID=A0ABR8T1D5_9BACL|nr:nucleotidyltransferase [Paenibacillus gallinarum]MBD7969566.1 nucleotidyltransferase [Paenibacillus gallinarum]
MPHNQSQFEGFHEAIKLSDESSILKEKRDIIINRLSEKMSEAAKPYTTFNQGSYAMKTGIKPLDGEDYDIDLGLFFEMSTEDVGTPVEAKKWVYDALVGHTNDVCMKKPCVTVTYAAGYHVDVTIYAAENSDGKVYLAKGKLTSSAENQSWDESNPKDLIKDIRRKNSDKEDRKQFRRLVRYLKRWKDVQFKRSTNGRPTGIALTSIVYHHMQAKTEVVDIFSGEKKYRDSEALIHLISTFLSTFTTRREYEGDNLVEYPYVEVKLPVAPYPNLLEKMTLKHIKIFKEKLEKLLACLIEARDEIDSSDGATILSNQFGDDFPVPSKDPGKRAGIPAVIPSTESA